MSALDLLKSDHERIRELFQKISQNVDPEERRKLFARIRDELFTHSMLEENVFYPQFEGVESFDDLSDFIDEAYEEHQEMRDMLVEFESLDLEQIEFEEKLDELIELAEEHFDAEEKEFFDKIQKTFPREQLNEIGIILRQEKDEMRKAA